MVFLRAESSIETASLPLIEAKVDREFVSLIGFDVSIFADFPFGDSSPEEPHSIIDLTAFLVCAYTLQYHTNFFGMIAVIQPNAGG